MDLFTKVREKILDHMIGAAWGAIVLLLSVFWFAVPSVFWAKLSAKVPVRVLWALAGLLLMGLWIAVAYVIKLRRTIKALNKLRFHFGVLWDREKTPHCAACRVPLIFAT